jgi:hypothetical protein
MAQNHNRAGPGCQTRFGGRGITLKDRNGVLTRA